MLQAGGVATRAAALLGVSRTTFYASLNRLNIDVTSLRR
jgi:transcriptional regulator of acetoin/glycerol metabolism